MKVAEFNRLVRKTRMKGKGLEAARLHFVSGIDNVAECGRQVGVNQSTAHQAVSRIKKEMLNSGELVEVTFLVPKYKVLALSTLVKGFIKI